MPNTVNGQVQEVSHGRARLEVRVGPPSGFGASRSTPLHGPCLDTHANVAALLAAQVTPDSALTRPDAFAMRRSLYSGSAWSRGLSCVGAAGAWPRRTRPYVGDWRGLLEPVRTPELERTAEKPFTLQTHDRGCVAVGGTLTMGKVPVQIGRRNSAYP